MTPRIRAQRWHARIESAGTNKILGAGFLVDARRIMTCAHVVDGHAAVKVTFPGDRTLHRLDAKVLPSRWEGGATGRGDIAILELDREVQLPAAIFAGKYALDERETRKLRIYGYPNGWDAEGAIAEVQPQYPPLLMDEWCQLVDITVRGVRMQKGFSGAAVMFADTGEVVGLFVGSARDSNIRVGKMLPVSRILRYWEPLAELLPVGPLTAAAKRELYAILEAVPTDAQLVRLYEAALPDRLGPPPTDFSSAWDVAQFLAEEVMTDAVDDHPLARFCMAVAAGLSDGAAADRLRHWVQQRFPNRRPTIGTSVAVDSSLTPASIIIQVERSAAPTTAGARSFVLTVWTLIDQAQARKEHCATLRGGEVRRQVERLLPHVIGCIPAGLPVIIHFVLPREWLTKPVDEWYADPDDRVPIGWSFPVVVRDLASRKRNRTRRIDQRWSALRRYSRPPLLLVDCRDGRDESTFTAWLEENVERAALVLANPPVPPQTHAVLKASLSAGVPVMLWSRIRCVDHPATTDPGSCSGDRFLRDLVSALAMAHVDELPEFVRRLRAQGYQAGDAAHCGKTLTLLWDDPSCRPELEAPLGLAGQGGIQ